MVHDSDEYARRGGCSLNPTARTWGISVELGSARFTGNKIYQQRDFGFRLSRTITVIEQLAEFP